ncbi:hypothetical protein ACLVWU_10020 [Bdellovibrio sp. HCB290]
MKLFIALLIASVLVIGAGQSAYAGGGSSGGSGDQPPHGTGR